MKSPPHWLGTEAAQRTGVICALGIGEERKNEIDSEHDGETHVLCYDINRSDNVLLCVRTC
jgi:hypothetical protein